jgi:hypothetical protein
MSAALPDGAMATPAVSNSGQKPLKYRTLA